MGIYFKVDRFLFQNREVPALKRRAHFSEKAGACFKQHLPFRMILLTKISRNQETIPSKKASDSSKQGATCLQQVRVCSNRRKQALNSDRLFLFRENLKEELGINLKDNLMR